MKNIFTRYFKILLLVPLFWACDKNFGEFNQNPVTVSSVEPALLFSSTQVKAATWDPEQMTSYCHAFMQYGWSDFWFGINYQLFESTYSRPWNNYYTQVLKDLEYVLPQLKGQADLSNTYAAARIWRVFIYQKLTDLYGDVPYSEAGKAFLGGSVTPAYDPQQQIYADFVTELRAARDGLNPAAKGVQGDQFYGGDITKWKKFANSLLLRIGMRLIKVDPTQAAALVQEAVNPATGGVMTSNDDQPVLKYGNSSTSQANGFYENLGDQHFTLHSTLVDHMISTGDPRLRVYGAVYTLEKSDADTLTATLEDFAAYDWKVTSPLTLTNDTPGKRTRARYDVFHNQALPFYHFPYSQVEFLLAEAILRGYISGDPNPHYMNGVTAHMQIISSLASNSQISGAAITKYLDNNPLSGTTEEKIATINTEFWVSGYIFQADEVWANWRRTGYPVLTPTPADYASPNGASNSPGVIPRKMPYPQNEYNLNSAQLTKALSNYGGGNDFSSKSRVWWDK